MASATEPADPTLLQCRAIRDDLAAEVEHKVATYGPSIRAFRFTSLLDKIHIKILRVRTIRDAGTQAVPDSIEEDVIGIHNYALFAVGRLRHECDTGDRAEDGEDGYLSDPAQFVAAYRALNDEAMDVMARKNHDYGAAWQVMAPETIFDEILARVYRIESLVSGGDRCERRGQIEDQLVDAANYCLFAVLRLGQEQS